MPLCVHPFYRKMGINYESTNKQIFLKYWFKRDLFDFWPHRLIITQIDKDGALSYPHPAKTQIYSKIVKALENSKVLNSKFLFYIPKYRLKRSSVPFLYIAFMREQDMIYFKMIVNLKEE
jgi:hypothetical protein